MCSKQKKCGLKDRKKPNLYLTWKTTKLRLTTIIRNLSWIRCTDDTTRLLKPFYFPMSAPFYSGYFVVNLLYEYLVGLRFCHESHQMAVVLDCMLLHKLFILVSKANNVRRVHRVKRTFHSFIGHFYGRRKLR